MGKIIIKEQVIPDMDSIMNLYSDVSWTAYTSNPSKLEQAISNSLKVWTAWDDDLKRNVGGLCMYFEKVVINLLPISGLFLSFYYEYKAKGDIDKYSGFRTALSTKTKQNWKYTHKYAAKLLRLYAISFMLLNIILMFSNFLNIKTMTIIVILQMLFYFIIGYIVNNAISKKK